MAENQHAQFIHARGTLKRTYEKLTKNKKLRIVYFGGSITVGFGSTDVEEKSWRALSGKWFREMFPQAEIELIRSAVGESGTYLGVYRLDRDIISLRPDLLFIEYAFNDSAHQADEKQAGLQYETIVRAIKERCPDCDIVTLITDGRNTIQDAALYPAAQGHERISMHYDIPTIWVSRALGAQLGEITEEKWKKYFLDTVHPTDAGYAAYWECLKEYLGLAVENQGFLASVTGMAKNSSQLVTIQADAYQLAFRIDIDGEMPYEPIRVHQMFLDEKPIYSAMARAYRAYKLECGFTPLKDKLNDGFKRLFGEAGHLMQLAFLAAGGVVKVKAAVRRVVVGMLQPARRREAAVIAVLGHQVHVDVRAVAVKAGILCQGFPPHSKQNAAASTPSHFKLLLITNPPLSVHAAI